MKSKDIAVELGISEQSVVSLLGKGYKQGDAYLWLRPYSSYALQNWIYFDNDGLNLRGKSKGLVEDAAEVIRMYEEIFSEEIQEEIKLEAQ